MKLRAYCLPILWAAFASAQSYTISTAVGTSGPPNNVPAKSTNFGVSQAPMYLTADSKGDVYFVYQNSVIRLDAVSGLLTPVAGNGTKGYSGDNGPAGNAQLNAPAALALDASGDLYIADSGNSVIRKVSGGTITTIAGTGSAASGCSDGPAASTPLNDPEGIAVDAAGNVYISDTGDNCLHTLSQGNLTRLAGTGIAGYFGDQVLATQARLNRPRALALDSADDVYVIDGGNTVVREITAATGEIATVAGNGQCCDFTAYSGSATQAELEVPTGLALDAARNLYLSDAAGDAIIKIANGAISVLAGHTNFGFSDGPVGTAEMESPWGIALDAAGNLYFADNGNQRIREISAGLITTIAGTGGNGNGGPANQAVLGDPQYVAVDAADNLYFSDGLDYMVDKVSAATGIFTGVAGNGSSQGATLSGASATSVSLNGPEGVAIDAAGNLYVTDYQLDVFKVSNGQINQVPGSGQNNVIVYPPSQSTDYQAGRGLAVDPAGNLYLASTTEVWQTTTVQTIALPALGFIVELSNGTGVTLAGNGTPSTGPGLAGNGGLAVNAPLSVVEGVALDSADNVYFADATICEIRKIDAKTGYISAVAGSGVCGYAGEGVPATSANLNNPTGIALDQAGNLYIADTGNNRVRKVSAGTGLINTIAGTGAASSSGDYGPATSAQLNAPVGVAVDSAGNVFVAEGLHIRVLTPSTGSGCTYSLSTTSLNAPMAGGTQSINVATAYYCQWAIAGLPSWISVSGPLGGTGNGAAALTLAANTGAARVATLTIAGQTVIILQTGPIVSPVISLVANAESQTPLIAPNTWVEIKGADLAPAGDSRSWTASDFVNGQLPTSLDGVSVTINGMAAYIYYISPTQVDVLTPAGAISGPAQVVLTYGSASPAFSVPAQAESTSFFVFNGGPYVAAVHANGGLVGPAALYPGFSTPAQPGETIMVYANGFGPTSTAVVNGAETQSGTLSPLPMVTIGGATAMVQFAGLVAVGEFQFNVVVPSTLPMGDQTISATYAGQTTQSGTLLALQ